MSQKFLTSIKMIPLEFVWASICWPWSSCYHLQLFYLHLPWDLWFCFSFCIVLESITKCFIKNPFKVLSHWKRQPWCFWHQHHQSFSMLCHIKTYPMIVSCDWTFNVIIILNTWDFDESKLSGRQLHTVKSKK